MRNQLHIEDAINLFGGCQTGPARPVSAQEQRTSAVPPGGPEGPGAAGSRGGHAVVDAYTVLSERVWAPMGEAPSGLEPDALRAGLCEIADHPTPALR